MKKRSKKRKDSTKGVIYLLYYIIRVHKVDSTITITTAPKMREKENYLEKQPCFDARKDASMKEKEGRGQNSKHFTQNIAKNKVLDE